MKYNLVTRAITFDPNTNRIMSDALNGNQKTGVVIQKNGNEYFVPAKYVHNERGFVPVVDEAAVADLVAELAE